MAFVLDTSDPLAANLEGYWLLDNLGPQEDLSGNNRTLRFVSNGVLNSTAYMSLVLPPSIIGETGVAAAIRCFTRTAGFVIEPGTPEWVPSLSFSAMSFWFNSSATPDDGYLVAANRTGWGNGANNNGFSVFVQPDPGPDGRIRTYNPLGNLATMVQQCRVERQTWQHVVIQNAPFGRYITVSGRIQPIPPSQMQSSDILTPRMVNANWNGIGSAISNTNVRNSSIASWSNLAIWSRELDWREMVRLYLEPLDFFGVVTPTPPQQRASIIT